MNGMTVASNAAHSWISARPRPRLISINQRHCWRLESSLIGTAVLTTSAQLC